MRRRHPVVSDDHPWMTAKLSQTKAGLAGVVNAVYYVVISITKPDRARKAGDMRIHLMICCVIKRESGMRKLALIVLSLFVLSLP